MENGIHSLDVRQESVSETLALGGALDETGNVHDGQVRGHLGGGLVQVAQPVKTLIGDGNARLRGI